MTNLPDDVRESDPRAPWNAEDVPRVVRECAHCGREDAHGEERFLYSLSNGRAETRFTPDHKCRGCMEPVCAKCAEKGDCE